MLDWLPLQTLPHCLIPACHHTGQACLAALLGRHYPAYYFFRSHDHLFALMVRLPDTLALAYALVCLIWLQTILTHLSSRFVAIRGIHPSSRIDSTLLTNFECCVRPLPIGSLTPAGHAIEYAGALCKR